MEILNTAVKIGAMSTHQATLAAAKTGVDHSATNLQQQLPDVFKKLSLENTVGQDQAISAPHLKPVTKMLSDQLRTTYPKATEAEVQQLVKAFYEDVGANFAPKQTNANTPNQQTAVDWDALLSTPK